MTMLERDCDEERAWPAAALLAVSVAGPLTKENDIMAPNPGRLMVLRRPSTCPVSPSGRRRRDAVLVANHATVRCSGGQGPPLVKPIGAPSRRGLGERNGPPKG